MDIRHRSASPPEQGRRRTRTVALLAAVGTATTVLTATAPVALAGAPVTSSSESLSIACEERGADGPVQLAVTVNADGDQVVLVLQDDDGSVVLHSKEWDATLTRTADRIVATVPMVDAVGTAAGDASLTIDVATAGPPEVTSSSAQTGNVRQQSVQEVQALTALATVVLPGHDAATLSSCAGDSTSWTLTTTSPNAFADRGPVVLNVECLLPLGDDEVASIFVEDGVHSVASVYVGTGEVGVGGESTDATVTRTGVTATIPVFAGGGEYPVGDAELALQLATQDRHRFVLRHSVGRQVFTIEALRVTGTLRLPDGRVVAVDCQGERSTAHEVAADPAGPKTTGPAPANDAPGSPVDLAPGGGDRVQTRAAASTPEVPLWCYPEPPQDPGFLPGHTVWYRFTGTGGPITVDTGGSGFNTTLAVYAVDGATLTEVACADDHFRDTWQARATVASDVGVRYLVQVGGVGGQAGLLHLGLS